MADTSTREQELEARWEKRVEDTISETRRWVESVQLEMRQGIGDLRRETHEATNDLQKTLSRLSSDNSEQHGSVEVELAELRTEVYGLTKRIDDILEQAKLKVEESTRDVESRNSVIKVMGVIIFGLVCFIAGVKSNAIGWIKELGFGG